MQLNVTVGGWFATISPATYTARADARGFTTSAYRVNTTDVVREVYVPETGLDFARWIDSFTNTSGADQTVTAQYTCYHYSCPGGEGCVTASSDGDETEERNDEWFVREINEDSGPPAVGLLLFQEGANETPSSVLSDPWGSFNVTFSVDVPAGETKKLMTFMVQAENTDDVVAEINDLWFLNDDAIGDLGGAVPDVENFVTDGRPLVRIGGPYVVPEGGSTTLEPFIFDREGDGVITAWDLDEDGAYDDGADLNALFDATLLDGDDRKDISLYVVQEDGLHEVFADGQVEVANVAPVVLSEPPPVARRGGHYVYTPVVEDPAGEFDPIEYELVEGEFPEAMTITPGGTIEWTPTTDDLDPRDHDVHLIVDDGDGGTFDQEWSIEVVENTPPFPPLPLYPIGNAEIDYDRPTFLCGNSADADGDSLTYHFRVDWDPEFRSLDMQETPPEGLPPSPAGVTEWQPAQPLINDLPAIYWECWVNDGIEDSVHQISIFRLHISPGPDADVDTDGDTDADQDAGADEDGGPNTATGGSSEAPGCGCRTSGGAAGASWIVLGGLVGLVARRRRSR